MLGQHWSIHSVYLLFWEVRVSSFCCCVMNHTQCNGSKEQSVVISHNSVGWLGSAGLPFHFPWSWLGPQSFGGWAGLDSPRRLLPVTGCWDGLSSGPHFFSCGLFTWPGCPSHVVFLFWQRVSYECAFQEEGSGCCQFSYVPISKFSEHDSCCLVLVRAVPVPAWTSGEGMTPWGAGTGVQG